MLERPRVDAVAFLASLPLLALTEVPIVACLAVEDDAAFFALDRRSVARASLTVVAAFAAVSGAGMLSVTIRELVTVAAVLLLTRGVDVAR